jgi:hypothetical protein
VGLFSLSLPLALFAARVNGAFESPIEVVQPLVTEQGIFPSTVSYVKYTGSLIPGYPVIYVGEASCVIDELGNSVNRNVANLLGIRTGYDPLHATSALLGDTLSVFVDLSSLTGKPPSGWSVKGAVEATVECVLATAYGARFGWDSTTHARVEAQYVQLKVQGSAEYAHLGGVFSFASLGELPRQRHFE